MMRSVFFVRRWRGAKRPWVALIGVLALAVLLPVVAPVQAPAADAHGVVVASVPTTGSTVTHALQEVRVTFDEPPLQGYRTSHGLRLLGPDGTDVSSGPVEVEGATLARPVSPTRAGEYRLLWSAVSEDGHPVSGVIRFDYRGPLASSAPATDEAPTRTAAPAPFPVLPLLATVALAGVLLIGGVVVVVLVQGRRRGGSAGRP